MLWVKAFHIIAVVCWFAALFYLPRLFVYHAMSEDQPSLERFEVMERKLYRGIATPAMFATLLLGIWLSSSNLSYYLNAGWFHAKLAIVIGLIFYHLACGRYMRQLREAPKARSHIFYRWFNEAPVLALAAIVIMVVVKPF